MSNVKLGVRVRPFTERELKTDNVAVVNVLDSNTVAITNIKVSASGAGDSRERVRRYYADYTFDSTKTNNEDYATQEKIFNTLGRDVLDCVSGGVSACVLAYGQSATGKTYTMTGSDAQPGLVPRICRAFYEQHSNAVVNVSFLEIYNEKVHDLLAGEEPPVGYSSLPRRRGNSRKDLRVREHPSRGTYVQNLRRVSVQDAESLVSLVGAGGLRRRTAPTRRNAASSRSHALLQLATATATLHLADLAGSEKASWEGCGGGRQKEGANINKSLVALSNVISALVVVGRFVPYRDSALTWLLKDCFAGGARAFVIATVSPSVSCYGESASTLRWAARARQLPPPAVSLHSTQTTKTALQLQLNNIINELATYFIRYIPETGKLSFETDHWSLNPDRDIETIREQQNSDQIEDMSTEPSLEKQEQHSESTASSIASGSSEVLNIMDNKTNLTNIISKEMDKLFGPSLERARSGSDLKLVAPLRVKRRQYRSQEVLPIVKTNNPAVQVSMSISPTAHQSTDKNANGSVESKPALQVPIFYDNQRAEIVASVTERLYSKLKKKEEAAVSKVEAVVDKKIMEPLSELKICTNARQRLIELSHKALRNKRRIGIPAHTQTRKLVIRMRDQGVDIQSDLQPYYIKERDKLTLHQDAGTETDVQTPRSKDIAVGPKCGSVKLYDISTVTDIKQAQCKNSSAMTDVILKHDRCTQTILLPPPRRKKRLTAFPRPLRSDFRRRSSLECPPNPAVININISQAYPDSESADEEVKSENINEQSSCTMTPDLLTNHNQLDIKAEAVRTIVEPVLATNKAIEVRRQQPEIAPSKTVESTLTDEFPDDDLSLPRVSLPPKSSSPKELEDIIMGKNLNDYPYNIVLSPYHEKESSKRTVKFKDVDSSFSVDSQTSWDWRPKPKLNTKTLETTASENGTENKSCGVHASTSSDSCDSSKTDSDTFEWKSSRPSHVHRPKLMKSNYVPVYKSNSLRSRAARAHMYREFLGLDSEDTLKNDSYSDRESQHNFKLKQKFFEDKFESDTKASFSFESLEKNILDSCNRMEMSVNRYEKYLDGRRQSLSNGATRTPREYLQQLVEIRRQMVQGDSDHVHTSDGSSKLF